MGSTSLLLSITGGARLSTGGGDRALCTMPLWAYGSSNGRATGGGVRTPLRAYGSSLSSRIGGGVRTPLRAYGSSLSSWIGGGVRTPLRPYGSSLSAVNLILLSCGEMFLISFYAISLSSIPEFRQRTLIIFSKQLTSYIS